MQEFQRTLAASVNISGIGLHSGHTVSMQLKPASCDTGIIFKRRDLSPPVDISVNTEHVKEGIMCTLLTNGKAHVHTIEHLMSALCMLKIDNLIIELNAQEVPVMDGSSKPFLDAINENGVIEQPKPRKIIEVRQPVEIRDADKIARVTPSDHTNYRFDIQWDHPVIANTPSTIRFNGDYTVYEKEIASARTFGFVEQLDHLHANELAKGASLSNAVGITNEGIMNEEGLRYPDEFVKHKLLDAIGDFYVAGAIKGAFYCYKSGHTLNNQLLKELFSDDNAYAYIEM